MGFMYFPDEVNKNIVKKSWIKSVYDWLFEESIVRTWIIVVILIFFNILIWSM